MSREISCVRPPILPRTDSRSFRVSVARGSIEYSAVTQPRPLPLRQRGTPCCTEAEQSTLVSPKLINAEPSAYFCQSRSIETGRSWSLVRASGRGMASRVVAASDRPGRPGQDGGMRTETLDVRTGSSPRVHDLTRDCASFVSRGDPSGDGLLNVFVPHATAGVAILETGAGSDDDLLAAIDDLLPRDSRWRHAHGSAGHGRDHVLPAFIAPSVVVPVVGGQLQLGTWQSICLVDTNIDNSTRTVRLSFLSG